MLSTPVSANKSFLKDYSATKFYLVTSSPTCLEKPSSDMGEITQSCKVLKSIMVMDGSVGKDGGGKQNCHEPSYSPFLSQMEYLAIGKVCMWLGHPLISEISEERWKLLLNIRSL